MSYHVYSFSLFRSRAKNSNFEVRHLRVLRRNIFNLSKCYLSNARQKPHIFPKNIALSKCDFPNFSHDVVICILSKNV